MENFEFMDEGDTGATDTVQKTFLFKHLDFEEAQALIEICQVEVLPGGHVIIEENSIGQALYIVKKGLVMVYKGSGDGKEVLAHLAQGEMVGEMSLIEDGLTSASVETEVETTLVKIDRSAFERLLENNELFSLKIYKSFCRILSERLRKTSEEMFKKDVHPRGVY